MPAKSHCRIRPQWLKQCLLGFWIKVANFDLKCFRDNKQLGVGDTTNLRLNLCQCPARQVQATNSTTSRKQLLRQISLIAKLSDLRPDQVFVRSHAPNSELDCAWTK